MTHSVQKLQYNFNEPIETLAFCDCCVTPTEDKIILEIIPSFADELSELLRGSGITSDDLRDWTNSEKYTYVDYRHMVKHALMYIYFKEVLVESIGGAYGRRR